MLAPAAGYVVRSTAGLGHFLHSTGTLNGYSWEPGILKAHAFTTEAQAVAAAGRTGEALANPFHRCQNCSAVLAGRCLICGPSA